MVILDAVQNSILVIGFEELDGPVVSALGVRSRKLSKVFKGHRMGDENFLSRAPPCCGRHVKPLVPAAFTVVSTHFCFNRVDVRQAAGCNNNYRIFITC
jgi:hypothetical protein